MADAEISKLIAESKANGGISLILYKIDLKGQSLSHLPRALPHLESLNLDGCTGITQMVLQTISQLTRLKKLSMRRLPTHSEHVTKDGIKTRVIYRNSAVNDLTLLATLRKLEELDLSGREELTDECLMQIGRITSLRSLNLSGCNITDEGLQALAKLKKLKSLYVHGGGITDEGVKALSGLQNLQSLDISGPRLSGECFKYLEAPAAPKLKLLKLPGCASFREGVSWPNRFSVARELLVTGDAKEILKAWRSGQEFLEARIAFVGMEGVGKSWLFRRCFLDEVVAKEEPRDVTEDIGMIQSDQLKWKPTLRTDRGERVITPNVWDFGGQLIKQGVHEPFFTSDDRTLFVLVLSAKRVLERDYDKNGHESGNGLDYWLKSLAHFAGKGTPVLIAVTQCDGFDPDDKRQVDAILNRTPEQLRQATGANVVGPVVDGCSACETAAESIEPLRSAIESAICFLPGLRSKVSPDLWRLKEVVTRNIHDRLSVSVGEYRQWCVECGISEVRVQDTYLRVLHQLGTLFFFGLTEEEAKLADDSKDSLTPGQRRFRNAKRDAILEGSILEPRWWKKVIYNIVDKSLERAWWTRAQLDEFVGIVHRNFTAEKRQSLEPFLVALQSAPQEADCMSPLFWKIVEGFEPKHDQGLIRASLELSELCFWDEQHGIYLFPRGLPDDDVATTDSWPKATAVFSFFPEAAFHRFIVKLHARAQVSTRRGRPKHYRWSVIATEPGNESVRVAVVADPENGTLELRMDPSSDETGRVVLARQLYDIFNGECMRGAGPPAAEVFPLSFNVGQKEQQADAARSVAEKNLNRTPKHLPPHLREFVEMITEFCGSDDKLKGLSPGALYTTMSDDRFYEKKLPALDTFKKYHRTVRPNLESIWQTNPSGHSVASFGNEDLNTISNQFGRRKSD